MQTNIQNIYVTHCECRPARVVTSRTAKAGGALLKLAGVLIVFGASTVLWCVSRLAEGVLMFEEAAGGGQTWLAFQPVTAALLGRGERAQYNTKQLERDHVD